MWLTCSCLFFSKIQEKSCIPVSDPAVVPTASMATADSAPLILKESLNGLMGAVRWFLNKETIYEL